jgi:glucan phosphoethanolaminetransferase (alkaline phosphatase superfamily)
MNLFNASNPDLIGAFLGFVFTLFVFSFAWGDNPFFRIATHIFVGVAAGYTIVIAIYNVILPQLIFPLFSGNRSEMVLAVVYLIPSALVLAKISPRLSKIGNPAMAILVGIGAAAAVGGAVIGTVSPQVSASVNIFENVNFINAGIILIGTLATLIYFQFSTKKKLDKSSSSSDQILRVIGWVGQAFIAVTFGALFAGVYFAALTALIERLSYLWLFVRDIVLPAFLG